MTLFGCNLSCCLVLALFVVSTSPAFADNSEVLVRYCEESGGIVETMPAQIGAMQGFSRRFCTFRLDDGFITVGLATFASDTPNIAASYMKRLPPISGDSPLLKGPFTLNVGPNLCRNLGGAQIVFVSSGGFSNHLGQSDICVFGDGSMVSAWSLYYMATGRHGYDAIKNKVRSNPLPLYLLETYIV